MAFVAGPRRAGAAARRATASRQPPAASRYNVSMPKPIFYCKPT